MALWTPALIDTALWLDAADASTLTLVSGAVSQWNDKSGNGRHATQSTSSARPIYNASTNSVDFGYDSKWLGGVIPGSASSGDCCGVIALNYASNGGGAINYVSLLQLATADANFVFWHYERTTAQDIQIYSSGVLSGAGVNSLLNSSLGEMLLAFEVVSGTAHFYRDGSLIGSSAITSHGLNTTQNYRIGKGTFASSKSIGGGYYEALVCSPGSREELEGYLAHKWGLAASLPTDHPYKNAAPAAQSVSGTITDDTGAPVARTVRAYNRSTGALLGETTSDATTGAYQIILPTADEIQRIVLDDEGGTLYNDIIDRVIPQ